MTPIRDVNGRRTSAGARGALATWCIGHYHAPGREYHLRLLLGALSVRGNPLAVVTAIGWSRCFLDLRPVGRCTVAARLDPVARSFDLLDVGTNSRRVTSRNSLLGNWPVLELSIGIELLITHILSKTEQIGVHPSVKRSDKRSVSLGCIYRSERYS